MGIEHFKVQLATPEREYVKVYKDFLNSTLLTVEEKMVYIALKSFVTYGQDSGKVFPSMETLCKLTSLSKPRATRTITSLTKKGIVQKTRRGLTKSNLYTLIDVPTMWGAETEEEMKELAETKIELSDEELLAELNRRGLIKIVKEKELDVEPTKAQQQALELNQYDIVNTTTNSHTSQEIEHYSVDRIRSYYDYETIVKERPYNQREIDSIMRVLYDVLNCRKSTIKIDGEDKPAMVVVGEMMKLTYSDIIHCIDNYIEISKTTKIKNTKAYMRTMLYNATDLNLDIANQVQYDMAHWNTED